MKTTRRRFIRRALWSVPVVAGLGTLPGCGGGGGTGPSGTAGSGPGSGSGSGGGTAPASGVDLSAGLTDYGLTPVKFSPLAKPAKGQTVQDPNMPGATITRITDAVADFQAVNVIPAYPTCQAWNCDETYLVLYAQGGNGGGQHVLYDGKTYAFVGSLNINPSDIEQFWWDRVDPNTMYYLSNYSVGNTYYSQMVAFNVQTGNTTVVFDFTDAIKAANGWPTGMGSNVRAGYPFFIGAPNNDLWGLGVGGIPNISGYEAGDVFGFQRSTGQITKYQGLPQAQARTNFPTPLPSGSGWFYNNENASNDALDTTVVYNRQGVSIGSVPFSSNEHCGSNQNAAGNDYLVGNQYDTPLPGNMIVANLSKMTVSTLVGQGNGYGYPRTGALVASACYNNPGWCVAGIVGSPYGSDPTQPASAPSNTPTGVTMLDQEIVIANADTGVIRRVCRHRSTGYWTSAPVNNYWSQPNVTLSPSGTRILVQSDWGNANPMAPVVDPNANSDTYVITLPSYAG